MSYKSNNKTIMENNEERKIRSLNKITARLSSLLSTLTILLSSSISLSLTSCTSSLDENPTTTPDALHEVTITLTGFNFTLAPVPGASPSGNPSATVPEAFASASTRSSDATASEAGITRIALKVFNTDGTEAASITQTSSSEGTDFNKLKLQLPAGTYTFVAVAHSATDNSVKCATITSPTQATLPEGIVPTLYSHVEEVTITNVNNQSVPLNMGKRVNAILHISSTDVVPSDVSKMAIDINSNGTSINDNTHVQFNPTTGLATNNPRYCRLLTFTVGQPLDASVNLLLPAQSYSYKMKVDVMDASSNTIDNYTRTFENVPFQQAYTTNATGTYFRYANSSSLSFDTTIGDQSFNLN